MDIKIIRRILALLILLLGGNSEAQLRGDSEPRQITMLKSQALAGEIPAQFNLAMAYQFGEGVDRNLEEALRWYLKAAGSGHDQSQFNLAFLLLQARHNEQAFYWFRQSAEQGLAVA